MGTWLQNDRDFAAWVQTELRYLRLIDVALRVGMIIVAMAIFGLLLV